MLMINIGNPRTTPRANAELSWKLDTLLLWAVSQDECYTPEFPISVRCPSPLSRSESLKHAIDVSLKQSLWQHMML